MRFAVWSATSPPNACVDTDTRQIRTLPGSEKPRSLLRIFRTSSALNTTAFSRGTSVLASVVLPAPGRPRINNFRNVGSPCGSASNTAAKSCKCRLPSSSVRAGVRPAQSFCHRMPPQSMPFMAAASPHRSALFEYPTRVEPRFDNVPCVGNDVERLFTSGFDLGKRQVDEAFVSRVRANRRHRAGIGMNASNLRNDMDAFELTIDHQAKCNGRQATLALFGLAIQERRA